MVDATYTEEQAALRDAVRGLLADRCDRAHVRAVAEGETGSDLDLYAQLVALGASDLPGPVEQAVVFEEAGRALAPVPLLSAVGIALPALEAIAEGGASELAAATRAGEAIPILAIDPATVPDAHVATHALIVEGGALRVVEAADLALTSLPTMDSTRRLARVDVPADAGTLIAEGEAARAAVEAAQRHGAVALAAELVGVAQACLDMAVAHAKDREQFGKPIGTYQAISHRCAEMFIAVESARSHTLFAAWAVAVGDPRADLAASQAKASSAEGAVACAQGCIQVHGGIGFTWEHDAHLYLKRARAGAALLGTATHHRRRIADLMGV